MRFRHTFTDGAQVTLDLEFLIHHSRLHVCEAKRFRFLTPLPKINEGQNQIYTLFVKLYHYQCGAIHK